MYRSARRGTLQPSPCDRSSTTMANGTMIETLLIEDHDLWAMINGSKPVENDRWKEMVELLRAG